MPGFTASMGVGRAENSGGRLAVHHITLSARGRVLIIDAVLRGTMQRNWEQYQFSRT